MTEAECLAAIAAGEADAYDLLVQADRSFENEFKRVDTAICKLLARVRRKFPDAQYYTASGGFNLMLGKAHSEDRRLTAQQQLIALSGKASIGDGDF